MGIVYSKADGNRWFKLTARIFRDGKLIGYKVSENDINRNCLDNLELHKVERILMLKDIINLAEDGKIKDVKVIGGNLTGINGFKLRELPYECIPSSNNQESKTEYRVEYRTEQEFDKSGCLKKVSALARLENHRDVITELSEITELKPNQLLSKIIQFEINADSIPSETCMYYNWLKHNFKNKINYTESKSISKELEIEAALVHRMTDKENYEVDRTGVSDKYKNILKDIVRLRHDVQAYYKKNKRMIIKAFTAKELMKLISTVNDIDDNIKKFEEELGTDSKIFIKDSMGVPHQTKDVFRVLNEFVESAFKLLNNTQIKLTETRIKDVFNKPINQMQLGADGAEIFHQSDIEVIRCNTKEVLLGYGIRYTGKDKLYIPRINVVQALNNSNTGAYPTEHILTEPLADSSIDTIEVSDNSVFYLSTAELAAFASTDNINCMFSNGELVQVNLSESIQSHERIPNYYKLSSRRVKIGRIPRSEILDTINIGDLKYFINTSKQLNNFYML